MKAFMDTDGSLQIRHESKEEQDQLKAWIVKSFIDVGAGFFPRIEIQKDNHAI